jgi:hypothetical protein
MSQILTAADEVIDQLTTLSSIESNWSPDVWAAYGDWAATRAPSISYNSVIERKDLVTGQLTVLIGFNFRQPFPNTISRCEQEHIYPIGVGVYQRFRAPGTESVAGIPDAIDRQTIDLHLQFVEELQDLLYATNLPSFHPHSSIEAEMNLDAIKKQYLESVMLVNYAVL